MRRNRLEAFSDGVLAIVITIMFLDIKLPHEVSWLALLDRWPQFLSYLLSFAYIGIYWNNHHHLLHTVKQVTGGILWANNHLLFWLSLVPFFTAWTGENAFAPLTVFCYGLVLFFAAIAYFVLVMTIIRASEANRGLEEATRGKVKEIGSMLLYFVGIGSALWLPILSLSLYTLVALWWMIPDRRIERTLEQELPE